MKKFILFTCSLVLLTFVLLSTVSAQPIPRVGAEGEAFRRNYGLKPELPKKPVIEEKEKTELPPPVEGETPFLIKKIVVEGNTVIPQKEIDPLFKKYIGQELTFTQLQAVANSVTNLFRSKGYVTSAAYFPPQKIDAGEVVIKITEGKIDKVLVEGNKWFRKVFVRKGYKSKSGDVFNYSTLEKDLVQLNLHPDRNVKAVIIPGAAPETSDVILKVKDRFPIHVGYSFDNLGTHLSGELRQGLSIKDTNFLTIDDIFYAKVVVSEFKGFAGVVTDYVLPTHNSIGTKLGFGFSWVRSRLGKALKYAKVIGHASTFTPSVTQPLFETKYLDCELKTGFNFKDSNTKLFGTYAAYDSIRSWTFGPNFTQKDPWGVTYFGNRFNFGFGGFLGGSTEHDKTSRPGVGSQFFHYDITATRLQPFVFDTTLIYRGYAQISQHELLPAEQLRIGGAETVRGYAEGEFLGDYGYVQNIELRIPPYFFPKDMKFPYTQQKMWDAIQFVHFFDIGKAYLWKHTDGQRSSMMLAGIGMGIRVSLDRYINGRFDWAWPLGDRPLNNNPRPRFHFSLNVEY